MQLALVVPAAQVEPVEAWLEVLGASAIEFQSADATPWLEERAGESSPWRSVRVLALFESPMQYANIRATLAPFLDAATLESLQWRTIEDRDWAREWMQAWKPIAIGERLWICPTWLVPPHPDAVNLWLDPGNAFGTGTHATTAMCLEWLEARDLTGSTLIDYGCGSGILGVAALLLGAQFVWACDTDVAALRVTRETAERNRVASRLWCGSPQSLSRAPTDIVIANILSNPLVALSSDLSRRVKSGGHLVLSGILESQSAEILAAYLPTFDIAVTATRDGWLRLDGKKRP